MKAWELEKVEPIECTLDDSGVYTVINRTVQKETHKQYAGGRLAIRVDVMATDGDKPLRSFVGPGNDVRKRVIAWIVKYFASNDGNGAGFISGEHASYIGYEIARAMSDPEYVQD